MAWIQWQNPQDVLPTQIDDKLLKDILTRVAKCPESFVREPASGIGTLEYACQKYEGHESEHEYYGPGGNPSIRWSD